MNFQVERMEAFIAVITLMTAALGLTSAWVSYRTAKMIYEKTREQQARKRKFLRFW